MKKIILIILPLLLTGCWSYIGLDQLTVVTGLAIDKGVNDNYKVTFEVLDLANTNEEGKIVTKLVVKEGPTIYEIVRNAESIITKPLCFCNAQLIIVSEEIVKDEGLNGILDFFIRNRRIRETSKIVVSQENTAYELLETKALTESVIALKINKIIDGSEKVNLYTPEIELYNIVNKLKGEGVELVLPVFRKIKIEEEEVVQLNGIGIFKNDKLNSYMIPEETTYFLFVVDRVSGGVISFSSKNNNNMDLAFNIYKSKTDVKYKYVDGKLKFNIFVKAKGSIDEYRGSVKKITVKKAKELTKIIEKQLEKRITDVILDVQEYSGSDIFGFGRTIYQYDFKLWEKIKKEWDQIFKNLNFEVKVELKITDTALAD